MDGALIPLYRKMHAEEAQEVHHFPGRSILQHAWIVNQMIRKNRSQTLLDYGCGLGFQYSIEHVERWWGIMPTLYDPAVERYRSHPSEAGHLFDGVIVSDVMEHVPEDEVRPLLRDIFGLACQWVFFSICCRPANRLLPDGTNAHCTLKPEAEWQALVKMHTPIGIDSRVVFTP